MLKLIYCIHFVPIASRSIPGHHWEELGSTFFTPSCQVFMHVDKISLSLPCSRLSNPSSLSLSSCDRCSKPLITLVALCWTRCSVSMSPLYWGAQHWTQHWPCLLQGHVASSWSICCPPALPGLSKAAF